MYFLDVETYPVIFRRGRKGLRPPVSALERLFCPDSRPVSLLIRTHSGSRNSLLRKPELTFFLFLPSSVKTETELVWPVLLPWCWPVALGASVL